MIFLIFIVFGYIYKKRQKPKYEDTNSNFDPVYNTKKSVIDNFDSNTDIYGPNIHNYEYIENVLYLEPTILETEMYETIDNYENV